MAGRALASRLELIEPLGEADRAALVALPGDILRLEPGQTFSYEGDVGCLVMIEGMACHYARATEDRRQLLSFYVRSDLPKLDELFVNDPGTELVSLTHSTIGVIRRLTLLHMVDERADIRRHIWTESGIQTSIARQWLIRNSTLSSVAACAHLICELYLRSSVLGLAHGDAIDFPLTQRELSEALGITTIHMNRTLQRLKQTGLISLRAGRLFVHDWQALSEFASFNPGYLAPLFARAGLPAPTPS